MAVDVAKIKQRLTSLQGERSKHESVWRDCFDYSLPHLGSGLNGAILGATDLQQQRARLLNGVAGEAMTTSADGFMGGMTPANALWFGLDAGRESDEERAWLDDAAKTIWENTHQSNFDAEAYDAVLSLLGAGWFVLYCDEDDGGGYYFENWPLAQCYISSTRTGGKVDTIYRQFELSALAAANAYGIDKLGATAQAMVRSGRGDEPIQILWAIEPRQSYLPGSSFASDLPWASCQVELTTGTVLRESGYHEFPCVVPRWRRIPGSAYGIGPMSDALPDAKTANEVERWELAAAETVIAPPLVTVDDGVLNARTIKLGPRKIIVANSIDSIKPLITGAKVEFGQLMVERLEAKVRRALMADLFDKVLNDPTMTATQVNAILGMIRQRMGPRFGRMQAEWLQVLIERAYGLALRAGVIGKPPRSLLQRNYSIKYLSPLARAQKLDELGAMDRHEQSLMAEAQVKPDVLDTFDLEEAARWRARTLGLPSEVIRDAKATDKLRKDRAEAQAAARQAEAEQQAQAASAEAMAANMAAA